MQEGNASVGLKVRDIESIPGLFRRCINGKEQALVRSGDSLIFLSAQLQLFLSNGQC